VRKHFWLRFTVKRKVHLIGMEACGDSYFLGRALPPSRRCVSVWWPPFHSHPRRRARWRKAGFKVAYPVTRRDRAWMMAHPYTIRRAELTPGRFDVGSRLEAVFRPFFKSVFQLRTRFTALEPPPRPSSRGFDMKSALPVAKFTGHETCSWTTSHFPFTFRETSVTRTVRSKGSGIIGSEFQKKLEAQTPLGRIGQPADIAPMAMFLASQDSG
jgi:hypothetical protein